MNVSFGVLQNARRSAHTETCDHCCRLWSLIALVASMALLVDHTEHGQLVCLYLGALAWFASFGWQQVLSNALHWHDDRSCRLRVLLFQQRNI